MRKNKSQTRVEIQFIISTIKPLNARYIRELNKQHKYINSLFTYLPLKGHRTDYMENGSGINWLKLWCVIVHDVRNGFQAISRNPLSNTTEGAIWPSNYIFGNELDIFWLVFISIVKTSASINFIIVIYNPFCIFPCLSKLSQLIIWNLDFMFGVSNAFIHYTFPSLLFKLFLIYWCVWIRQIWL